MDALERLLARLGRFLGGFWVPGTSPALDLKGSRKRRTGFLSVSGLCFTMVFAAPCALLPNTFLGAVTTIFAFAVAVFLLFQCGGLCAAHGIRTVLDVS